MQEERNLKATTHLDSHEFLEQSYNFLWQNSQKKSMCRRGHTGRHAARLQTRHSTGLENPLERAGRMGGR